MMPCCATIVEPAVVTLLKTKTLHNTTSHHDCIAVADPCACSSASAARVAAPTCLRPESHRPCQLPCQLEWVCRDDWGTVNLVGRHV